MDYLSINKELWNKRTKVHIDSDFYDVKSFLRSPNSLNSIELNLLGDVKGKRILHLQCHFGMDTISLTKKGAVVTGVDLSPESIRQAKELAAKCQVEVRFIESDIYKLSEVLNEQFDIVFTSYGTIGWLPSMPKWAQTIKHFLKPKAKFVFVEFHPVVWMFSYDFSKVEYNYSDSTPIVEEIEGSYTDGGSDLKEKSVSWNHGLALVINSLLQEGMTLANFQEYFYSPYNCFENTVEIETGKFQIKGHEGKLPMVYSLVLTNS